MKMPSQNLVYAFAVLSPDLMSHVRSRVPAALVPKESTVREVERALNTSSGLLVIADPSNLHPDAFRLLMGAAANSAARVLLYGRLTPLFAERVLDAEQIMLVGVAIAGTDDDWLLRHCLVNLAATVSMPARVMRGVADRLDRLTTPLRTTVVGLFAGVPVPDRAEDFYSQFSVNADVSLRRIHEVGLAGTHEVLTAIRLCHAWASLKDSGIALEAIANRYGFGSTRTLSDNCVHFAGLPPRMAGRQLSAEEFALRIIARLKSA